MTGIDYYSDGNLKNSSDINTNLLINNRLNFKSLFNRIKLPVTYCSVSPEAEKSLIAFSESHNIELFNLNYSSFNKIKINYPNPKEIGQDRIANTVAAINLSKIPCIIIDIGTATTFDIITKNNGYEGGIIIPGPQGMLDFLNQNTALLPKLSYGNLNINQAIGKTTKDAMLLGTNIGYPNMINSIVERIKKDLSKLNQKDPLIIKTGGHSEIIKLHDTISIPRMTTRGLAFANQQEITERITFQ